MTKPKITKKAKGAKPAVNPPTPRRVLIATPVGSDAAVKIWYADALANCMRMAGGNLFPIYLENIYVQVGRNRLMAMAIDAQVDDLIWIDSDVGWQPEDLFRLLEYPVDVVGGIYPKKSDVEAYPVQILGNSIPIDPKTGLLEVDGLGTGFLRMTRKALQALWDSNPEYTDDAGNVARWICSVDIVGGKLVGEDIVLCHKLRDLGFKIYLDPLINCTHHGLKTYTGNFAEYILKLQKN